jgi:hypothetical protein
LVPANDPDLGARGVRLARMRTVELALADLGMAGRAAKCDLA